MAAWRTDYKGVKLEARNPFPGNLNSLDEIPYMESEREIHKKFINQQIVAVVQSWSHVWLFGTPWTAAFQAPLSSPLTQSILKIHIHWVIDTI